MKAFTKSQNSEGGVDKTLSEGAITLIQTAIFHNLNVSKTKKQGTGIVHI